MVTTVFELEPRGRSTLSVLKSFPASRPNALVLRNCSLPWDVARKEVATSQGKLQFRKTSAFGRLAGKDFRTPKGEPARGSSSKTGGPLREALIPHGYPRA